jgi:hypothetical protein
MTPVTEREQLQDTGTDIGHTAKEAVSYVSDKAEHATEAIGAGIEAVGRSIQDHSPDQGILSNAGHAIGAKLEAGGQYLHDQGLSGVAADITNCVRRNPIPSLLIGLGVGFLLARLARR